MISDYYPLFMILGLAIFVGFFVVGLGSYIWSQTTH